MDATMSTLIYEEDFDADGFRAEYQVSFTVRGETFTCKLVTMDDRDWVTQNLAALKTEEEYFKRLLEPESFERFKAMANDPDVPLRKETMTAVANDLARELLGIETTPKSSGSSGTSKRKGRKSTGD